MPVYEYRCRTCGHQFEAQQSFSDDPLTECPECAGELRKVFSPVGISFKGSGFYKNDSRSGSSSGTGSPAKESDSSPGSGSSEGGSAPASPDTSPSTSSSSGDSSSSSTSSPATTGSGAA